MLDERGVKNLHRRQHEGKAARVQMKLTGRSDWFKKKDGRFLGGEKLRESTREYGE